LDPGVLHYSVNLTYLLINNGRISEAQIMINRIRQAAGTDPERMLAANLQQTLDQRKTWEAQKQAMSQNAAAQSDSSGPVIDHAESETPGTSAPATEQYALRKNGQIYAAEGAISDADCSKRPEFTINMALKNGPVTFHAPDSGKVVVTHADGVHEPSLGSCDKWKGRNVKVWFSASPGKEFAGEITKLYFY
jgi:hypothetical protein